MENDTQEHADCSLDKHSDRIGLHTSGNDKDTLNVNMNSLNMWDYPRVRMGYVSPSDSNVSEKLPSIDANATGHENGGISENLNGSEPKSDDVRSSSGFYDPLNTESSYLRFNADTEQIDFVLVYRKSVIEKRKSAREKLDVFHQNLRSQGLQLELDIEDVRDEVYVKIHAPFDVLARYAEVLKLRMPVTNINSQPSLCKIIPGPMSSFFRKLMIKCGFEHLLILPNFLPELKPRVTWPFVKTKEYLFDVPGNLEDFFTYTERSHIVNYILRHCKYAAGRFSFGIGKLLNERVYLAAYPMHDGPIKSKGTNLRSSLAENWANFGSWYKPQPLDHIKNYFGSEIAFYFAWMGHYTFSLIFLSIICIVFLIYGIVISFSDVVATEVCFNGTSVIMCPLCDKQCPYWRLSDSCAYARISRVFNNQSTVCFTIIISIWGLIFNISWQRSQAEFIHRWNLPDVNTDMEAPRPEFNHYMQSKEEEVEQGNMTQGHDISWKKRFPTFLLTFSTVIFLVCLALAFVFSVIVYRVSVFAALKGQSFIFARDNASLISVATAAFLNLINILALTLVYQRIAIWLTNKELLRTDSEYHDSLALKLYLLEFVNNYGSVFYIAFFKGKFSDIPGKSSVQASFMMEKCDVGGCMVEVTIQMAVVFIGKQILMNLKDPVVIIMIRIFQRIKDGKIHTECPYASDFQLCEYEDIQLFFEYMEMMIQYGFMCFFIAAFPIAPLFALGNNLIEIRRDSKKLITSYRRSVAKPVNGIGIWSGILFTITRMAPLSNALLIAFTSDFIPSTVYSIVYSPTYDLRGYTNFSLSYFNISDFDNETEKLFRADTSISNVTFCRYRQFRNPPNGPNPYEYSPVYWEILAAQLLFVLLFENTLLALLQFFKWLLPERPRSLREHINIETNQVAEFILHSEVVLAKIQPMVLRLKSAKGRKTSAAAAPPPPPPPTVPEEPVSKPKGSKETYL